jgi:hypothetical protein
MQFIRDAQARYGTMAVSNPTSGCQPIASSSVPAFCGDGSAGWTKDNVCMSSIVDTMVQALSCDVARCIAFDSGTDALNFDWMFTGTSPFVAESWHNQIHGASEMEEPHTTNVLTSFAFFAQTFTSLVQKLAAVTDVDGQRLLDNTLVLWTSEMGYGPTHGCYNIPTVLAGMKSAFPKGQGRHVVPANRCSLGDLYAQILRVFGGTDMTFGLTGTLQNTGLNDCNDGYSLCADMGAPAFITPDTPLHMGPLDL